MIAGNQGNMGADLYVDDNRFLVHSTDFVSLAYEFRGSGRKPFVRTLVGPSGRNMLDAPAADHAHHLGIWWGHGDVNGIDFYLEMLARRSSRGPHRTRRIRRDRRRGPDVSGSRSNCGGSDPTATS